MVLDSKPNPVANADQQKTEPERICQSCKSWTLSGKNPRPWGNCMNEEVIQRVDSDLSIKDFSPDFDFGCRYWQAKA